MTDSRPDDEDAEARRLRGIERLLRPRSVAIIGASADSMSLSGRPLRFLKEFGYGGRIYPVNPSRTELEDIKVYASVKDTPEVPDLAVVAVRADKVLAIISDCASAGVSAVVILTSGFSEQSSAGRALEEKVLAIAREGEMLVLGPNCEGFLNLADRVAIGFSPVFERTSYKVDPGASVAVVSQSGGLGFSVLDAGLERNLNVSYIVSTGNEADVDVLDLTDVLLEDANIRVVVMIVEGFQRPNRLSAVGAHALEKKKRLVVAKLGTSPSGSKAVVRHTAHDAGFDALYRAGFRRYGVTEAFDQEDVVDLSLMLSEEKMMLGARVGIITTSGGAGVWLADACEKAGLAVPQLSEETQARVTEFLPAYGAARNPIDVTAQSVARGQFSPILKVLLESGEVDAIALVSSLASAGRLVGEQDQLKAIVQGSSKPIVLYSYTVPALECVERLAYIGVPWFPSPARLAGALSALLAASLREHAAGIVTTSSREKRSLREMVQGGKALVGDSRLMQVLRNYGLPTLSSQSEQSDGGAVDPLLLAGDRLVVGGFIDGRFGPHVAVGFRRPVFMDLDAASLECAPVDRSEASAALMRLGGWITAEIANSSLADVVVAISELVASHCNCIQSLELDPVVVLPGARGVYVLGARLNEAGNEGWLPRSNPSEGEDDRGSHGTRYR